MQRISKAPASPPAEPGRALVILLTLSAGSAIANTYSSQPLLPVIAQSFQRDLGAVGMLAGCLQIGYTLGLLVLVPLGDRLNRKILMVGQSAGLACVLGLAALAPSLGILLVISLFIGMLATLAVQSHAFAAQLAPPHARGRMVGSIAMGIALGILLGRSIGGAAGEHVGWRGMFALSAALMLLLTVLLAWRLPATHPTAQIPYSALLRSLWPLLCSQPALQLGALIGALWFAAFSAFWATLAAHVAQAPFGYGPQTAGLFGLVGVVGALGSRVSGVWADRYGVRRVIVGALICVVLAFAIAWVYGSTLWGLVLGVLLLDLGAFGAQVPNQARIFALCPEARSRIYSIYMLIYYLGGALGSALGPWIFAQQGWAGMSLLCTALSVTALVISMVDIQPHNDRASGHAVAMSASSTASRSAEAAVGRSDDPGAERNAA